MRNSLPQLGKCSQWIWATSNGLLRSLWCIQTDVSLAWIRIIFSIVLYIFTSFHNCCNNCCLFWFVSFHCYITHNYIPPATHSLSLLHMNNGINIQLAQPFMVWMASMSFVCRPNHKMVVFWLQTLIKDYINGCASCLFIALFICRRLRECVAWGCIYV